MMTLSRVMLFIFLIHIIAAARFPERRSAQIASTPNYHSEDYNEIEVEDKEPLYSTTEFPYSDYTTESYSEEESTEESIAGFFENDVTVPDLADGQGENSLSKLFYKTHPVKKLDIERCESRVGKWDRKINYMYLEHAVYLSSMDSNHLSVGRVKPKAFDWQEAHDLCQSQCKEIFTVDTLEKAYLLSKIIKSDGLLGIWTSGRRCDFPGCRHRYDVAEDGWFWSTSGQEIFTGHTTESLFELPYQWATTGLAGPQPDNAEFAARGVNESCLALRFEGGQKGLKLYDMPCHNKLNVVCEGPRELYEL